MTIDSQSLISGYLDDTLAPEEFAALQIWLKETPEHTEVLVQAVLLHDRLRNELQVAEPLHEIPTIPTDGARMPRLRPLMTLATTLIAVTLLVSVFVTQFVNSPASAAVVELNRLLAANAVSADRTYHITVESDVPARERGRRKPGPEAGRPPKPPLDEAVLYVRGGRQFVLVRRTESGQPFVTGCNGQVSWAVRPDGPVRVSPDLTRFDHDLPGHEHDMPLINIEEDLERVRDAYDIQLLPAREAAGGTETIRTLVATKHRKARGPERVDITYDVDTGQIRELRFIDMPYGGKHLTVRLTLTSERNLGSRFCDHEQHHGPERAVEFED